MAGGSAVKEPKVVSRLAGPVSQVPSRAYSSSTHARSPGVSAQRALASPQGRASPASVTATVAGAEDVAVRDDNDKVNYSIGYQIGGDLKRQGVQLVPEVMVRAIRDALDGSEPLMSDEERRGTLVALSRKLAAKEEEQRREAAVKNLQAGRAFMSENKVRDGVKTL